MRAIFGALCLFPVLHEISMRIKNIHQTISKYLPLIFKYCLVNICCTYLRMYVTKGVDTDEINLSNMFVYVTSMNV